MLTAAERDLLRGLYGHRRLVLADGIDQLVRRQIACDWNAGVPSEERVVQRLDDSLRMLRNIATFANCFARVMDFATWRIAPREEFAGGRVLIVTGDVMTPEFVRSVVSAAHQGKADPVDCLVCAPSRASDGAGDARLQFLEACAAADVPVWDGTVPAARADAAAEPDALRLVRYDSCRGLEGWVTVALDLDDLYRAKQKYLNHYPNDPEVAAELVAQRWLLIPLTRAVHTLIITVRDPESHVARMLKLAADDPAMPRGVVEWVDVAGAVERLSSV